MYFLLQVRIGGDPPHRTRDDLGRIIMGAAGGQGAEIKNGGVKVVT